MMRFTLLITAAVAVASTACAPTIQVRTYAGTDAEVSGRRTYRVPPPLRRRANVPALAVNGPMLDNSITSRALRNHLARAFEVLQQTVAAVLKKVREGQRVTETSFAVVDITTSSGARVAWPVLR